jgi:DegT/DnrJ/EryC1/StrS aminotransferase family protein
MTKNVANCSMCWITAALSLLGAAIPRASPPGKCINFERELAARQGTRYCVAVTSGTTALITAMVALEVGPGDEVILPGWTDTPAMTLSWQLAGYRSCRDRRFHEP